MVNALSCQSAEETAERFGPSSFSTSKSTLWIIMNVVCWWINWWHSVLHLPCWGLPRSTRHLWPERNKRLHDDTAPIYYWRTTTSIHQWRKCNIWTRPTRLWNQNCFILFGVCRVYYVLDLCWAAAVYWLTRHLSTFQTQCISMSLRLLEHDASCGKHGLSI